MRPERGRAHIIQEIREGRLDPTLGEELSIELGWGELRPHPDATQFDPRQAIFWSLCQCVAYLSWSEITAVLLCDPFYARAFKLWRRAPPHTYQPKSALEALTSFGPSGARVEKWNLIDAAPPAILWLIGREKRDVPPIPSLPRPGTAVEAAFYQVVGMLQAGSLTATATNIRTNATDRLSDVDWVTCGFGMESNGHGQPLDTLFRSGSAAYRDVNIRVLDFLTLINRATPDLTSVPEASPPTPKKRGRKSKAIWPEFYMEVLRLYRENSEPGQDAVGWEDQATVERIMAEWLDGKGFPSAPSTVRQHVGAALDQARSIISAEN